MPVDIRIEDSDLTGFSDPAKLVVEKAGDDFVKAVIAEANRIESGQNNSGGPVEITHVMVSDAVIIQRRSIGTKKTSGAAKFLRVTAAVASLIVGFMYDDTKLQNSTYMGVFLIAVAATIILTTIATIKE